MKKVLIITYYWPPAGGPGIQRVLKFCTYLQEFGWQPVVLTVKEGEYPALDETLLDKLPADCPVYQTAALEPFSIYRKMTGQNNAIPTFVLTEQTSASFAKKAAAFIRGNFFIPDARVGWKPFAVRKGLQVIEQENIDLIFSTAPPMSGHLIAKKLAAKSGLSWVADFRDPWTDVFYYHNLKRTRLAVAVDKKLERSVLQKADAVITVSQTIVDLFKSKVDNHYHIIANGYDERDFPQTVVEQNDTAFIINHAGHLADNQNPVALWQALQKMIAGCADFVKKLHLDFYGSIHSNVEKSIEKYDLKDFVTFHGYVPHQQIIQANQKADVLLFVVAQCSYANGILTSKLFDYMGAQKPILGIGPVAGDASKILQQTRAGQMLDWNDTQGISNFIQNVFLGKQQFQNAHTIDYQRRNLTYKLAEIFNQTYAE